MAAVSAPASLEHDVIEVGAAPTPAPAWLRGVWRHRGVLWMLTKKDFQVRYKRASLGVLWAVAVPLVQAAVLAIVFSRVVRVPVKVPYAPLVFSGMVAWSYFALAVQAASTSIVDAAGLTDKVFFPRVLLAIVPCLANTVSLAVSTVALLAIAPAFGAPPTRWLLVLFPAVALLVAMATGFGLVLSALDVYFRDVKFLVTAALLVWMYITPIVYPQSALKRLGPYLDFNPITGVVDLFHLAVLGPFEHWHRAVIVSVASAVVLLVVGLEAQRRHDRLFVDLL